MSTIRLEQLSGIRQTARTSRKNEICGYKKHRDIVGAINIISAPVIDGKSLSA